MSLTTDRDKLQPNDKPTLYKQIRLDIERQILTGEWPPGHRIPFEHELMVRYGCSRMTVNKALSELAQADLIERRRRAGTFVRRPKFLSAVLQITDIRAEITKGLIERRGCNCVAVEADWPDAYQVNRWVRGASGATTAPSGSPSTARSSAPRTSTSR